MCNRSGDSSNRFHHKYIKPANRPQIYQAAESTDSTTNRPGSWLAGDGSGARENHCKQYIYTLHHFTLYITFYTNIAPLYYALHHCTVFRSTVALHSFRLKLCSVKYIVHCTITLCTISTLVEVFPPQLHQRSLHHNSPAAAHGNILTNCFSIGPTVAARHELVSTALHYTALHCTVLYCTAVTTVYCTPLPCPALHCPSAPAPLVTLPVQCRETGSGLTAARVSRLELYL